MSSLTGFFDIEGLTDVMMSQLHNITQNLRKSFSFIFLFMVPIIVVIVIIRIHNSKTSCTQVTSYPPPAVKII